jgi:beta-1,4-mannosyl-glycoprotein beta-1,4-N-acetylglucosaminyltransferase
MSKPTPLIWDTFTFWNENDMANARIEYLYPYVDKFVLVESNTQHDGSKKDFVLDAKRLEKYWDKIIYIQDSEQVSAGTSGWGVENHHRNCIKQGLSEANNEDIILISDIDEIPDPKHFPFLLSDRFQQGQAYSFLCDFYNYFVNILASLNPCVGTIAVKKGTLDKTSPQHMRNVKDTLPRLLGGWHMSYLGGAEQIWKKFTTSCDVLNKKEIPPIEIIKETLKRRLKEGQFNLRHDIDLPVFYIKNPTIPNSIIKEKYPHFFLEDLENL